MSKLSIFVFLLRLRLFQLQSLVLTLIIIVFVCEGNVHVSVYHVSDECLQSHSTHGVQFRKSCFGLPKNCVSKGRNCEMLLSFWKSPDDNVLNFNFVKANVNATDIGTYIAVGFSETREMESGSVIGCYLSLAGEYSRVVKVREFYIRGWEIEAVDRPEFGHDEKHIFETSKHEIPAVRHNTLSCKFSIKPNIDLTDEIGKKFNLITDKVFLMLLGGSKGANDETLGHHISRKGVSSRKLSLSEILIVNEGPEEVASSTRNRSPFCASLDIVITISFTLANLYLSKFRIC